MWVSLTGTWIQQTTVAWLAFRVTGSSLAVGAALVCTQLPILALAPLAGAINDRYDRRQVLMCTQLAGLMQALSMLGVLMLGRLEWTALFALSLCAGVINALDLPARQSIVASLVPRRTEIRSAIAINAAGIHLARLLGPALAALLLMRGDARYCFGTNALSCAFFLFVLLRLRVQAHEPIRRLSLQSLRDAWAYSTTHRATRQSLTWIAIASFLAIPYTSLLPAAAQLWSPAAPISYPVLMVAAGVGALAAALLVAQFQTDIALQGFVPLALFMAAIGLLLLGLAGQSLPAIVLLAINSGLSFMLTLVVSGGNIVIQNSVPEDLRGRLSGLFVMLFNGVAPLGALVWGLVADRYTVSVAFITAGVILGLAALSRLKNRAS